MIEVVSSNPKLDRLSRYKCEMKYLGINVFLLSITVTVLKSGITQLSYYIILIDIHVLVLHATYPSIVIKHDMLP